MNMRFHRANHKTVPEDVVQQRSSVHVLRDEQEIRAALQRAAEFDQRTADMLLSRSAHYRALIAPADPGHEAD